MTSYLLAGPAQEPVSLADAKAYLKLDDDAEDGLVATLISAARLHVESLTGRALIAQTWRLTLDAWPADRVVTLPVGPILSLTSVTTYDSDGDAESHSIAEIALETHTVPARVFVPPNLTESLTLSEHFGIEIDYVAGFGSDADSVPADLKQALLTLLAYWFENRDAVIVAGSGAVTPLGFDRLLAPYRRVRL